MSKVPVSVSRISADSVVPPADTVSGRLPLVSIIIDNYNYARYLPEAIESALSQTYRPTEVIVVDDGSADDSREIIAGYGERVIPVVKENGGQASAFNAGLAYSRGEIVLFLDADDILLPDTVRRVVDAFVADPALVKVQYRLAVVDAAGRPTGSLTPPAHLPLAAGDVRRRVLSSPDDIPYPPTSGNAFAARVLRQIFPVPEQEYRICADYYLSNLSSLFGRIGALEHIGGSYRTHDANKHHTAEIDLNRTRDIITLTGQTHGHIVDLARALGLKPGEGAGTPTAALTFLAHRLVSLKLGRSQHPLPADRVLPLAANGARAALSRPDLSWTLRLFYVLWFFSMVPAPRSLARWLATVLFIPERRQGLNALFSLLQGGSEGACREVSAAGRAGEAMRSEPTRLSRAVLAAPILLAVAAEVLWAVSLRSVDIHRITDLGLASVLQPATFLAGALLIASFCLALRRQVVSSAILAPLAVAVVMLYGTPTLIEPATRIAVAWRHVGFTEYIMRTGSLAPTVETYFNWPGFFTLAAFVTQIAGYSSALSLTPWATVFFNLAYLGALVLILRTATADRRAIALGAWFYALCNWPGQDYFAPQAFTYLLYLVIVAILLRWFNRALVPAEEIAAGPSPLRWLPGAARLGRWLRAPDLPATPSTPVQRVGLMAIVIALFAVTVTSHQLTPFFMLAVVTLLTVCGRLAPRGLPILLAVMVATWLSFMTVPFLAGHLGMVTGGIGRVDGNVNANVTQRLQGSPDHVLVVRLRLVMTLAIWALALLGGIRRLRAGYRDLSLAVLAVAPFSLLLVQPYGGEVLIRAYFFALPAMAFFAAALFFPVPARGVSWGKLILIGLVSLGLMGGFLFSRYGNERIDYFTAQEVDAVRFLYQVAPRGSVLVYGAGFLPLWYKNYEQYAYQPLRASAIRDTNVDTAVAEMVRARQRVDAQDAYLIITRSDRAFVDMFSGFTPGALERLQQALIESGLFEILYRNEDVTVLVLRGG